MDRQPQSSEFKLNAIADGRQPEPRRRDRLELGERHPIARELARRCLRRRSLQYRATSPSFEGILYGPEHPELPLHPAGALALVEPGAAGHRRAAMTAAAPPAGRSLREAVPAPALSSDGSPRIRPPAGGLRATPASSPTAHVRPRALEIDRTAGEGPELVRLGSGAGGRPARNARLPDPPAGGRRRRHRPRRRAIVMEELCAACPGIGDVFGAHALGRLAAAAGRPLAWDGVLAELAPPNAATSRC